MTYTLPAWADLPATTSALSTANLSLYNVAISDMDTRITAAQTDVTVTAVKTASYSTGLNEYVPVDTTSGSVTVTFPVAPADKTLVGVKHVVRGGTNTVTLQLGGSDHFNTTAGPTSGALTVLNQGATFQYVSSTAVWMTVAGDLPLSQLDLRYSAPFVVTAVKTANYTANPNEFVPVDTTSGNVTVTFPTAPADKTQVGAKHVVRGGSNTVTLALGGSDHFDTATGPTTATLGVVSQASTFQYVAATAVWILFDAVSSQPNIQVFTSSGTWTKPPGVSVVTVAMFGGGSGGGSGARLASATVSSGGAGGGGGGFAS